eukprot:49409-Lingulodinium_polyedra.AAC.1
MAITPIATTMLLASGSCSPSRTNGKQQQQNVLVRVIVCMCCSIMTTPIPRYACSNGIEHAPRI